MPRWRSRTAPLRSPERAARAHASHRGPHRIEAFNGAYDPRERSRWTKLADDLGLVCTGGSDWHGPEEATSQPGVDLPPDRSDALVAWLAG